MAAGSDRFRSLLTRTAWFRVSGSALVPELAARLGLERELSPRAGASVHAAARARPGPGVGRSGDDADRRRRLRLGSGGACRAAGSVRPGRVAVDRDAAVVRARRAGAGVDPGGAPERARAGLGAGSAPGDGHARLRRAAVGVPHREGGRRAAPQGRLRLPPAALFPRRDRRAAGRGCCGPGNAGSNTAADHVTVLEQALAQLPAEVADRERERAGGDPRPRRRGRRHARLRGGAAGAQDPLLARLLRRRARREGGAGAAEAALAAGARRRGRDARGRLGRRADRPGRPQRAGRKGHG